MAESGQALAGKVAFVTGASRGIGRDVAVALSAAGADVVIASRSEAVTDPRLPGTIYSVAKDVEQQGRRALPVKVDVTKDEEIAAAVEQTMQTFGRIDILFNNAGVAVGGPVEYLPIEEWRRQFEVNVIGQIAVTQAVLPLIRGAGDRGRIVFMGSIGGRLPPPFVGPYAASKSARS